MLGGKTKLLAVILNDAWRSGIISGHLYIQDDVEEARSRILPTSKALFSHLGSRALCIDGKQFGSRSYVRSSTDEDENQWSLQRHLVSMKHYWLLSQPETGPDASSIVVWHKIAAHIGVSIPSSYCRRTKTNLLN